MRRLLGRTGWSSFATFFSAALMQTGLRISSFGEDEAGELYLVDYKGAVYRLAAARATRKP